MPSFMASLQGLQTPHGFPPTGVWLNHVLRMIELAHAQHPEIEENEDQLRARALPLRHNAIAHPCPNTLLLARHQQALCVDGGFQLYGLSRRELEALWAGK